MNKKQLIGSLLIIISVFIFSSSGSSESEDEEFTIASSSRLEHFDPHNSDTTAALNITSQVYETLTKTNDSFQLEFGLGLAKTWDLLTPTSWTFQLHKGIQFHDGSDFTAEDVVASWERARQGTEGTVSVAKEVITAIDVIDDYEITIHTKNYNPVFPASLTSFQIMDKDWIAQHSPTPISSTNPQPYILEHANGTGPYKLVSVSSENKLVFERFDEYWNKNTQATIEIINYVPIDKAPTRIASLISGQVDLIFPVPIQDWDRIEKESKFKLTKGLESRPIFLGLDQYRDTLLGAEAGAKDNPFKNKSVREAINLAIDIDTINKTLLGGNGLPIGILSAPGLGGHPNDERLTSAYGYDVEKAKALLKSAGYENGFKVRLNTPNDRYVKDAEIAEAVKNYLAKVNIEVDLQTEPRSTYFGRLFNDREVSFYMLGWHPIAASDFDIVKRLLSYPEENSQIGSYNIGKFKNTKINEITKKLEDPDNFAEFDSLIQEAYEISKADFAYVPLVAPPISAAVKKEYDFILSPKEEVIFSSIRKSK